MKMNIFTNFRFVGPARELYMGDYPFRGAFGGPPIFATINGVRHKICLSGPAPEVKIVPEPAFDLLKVEQKQWQQNASSAQKRQPLLEMPGVSTVASDFFENISKCKKI